MLSHSITVHDVNGTQLSGQVGIGVGERAWRFTPATPWKNKAYTIRVANQLEDISGNNALTPLDIELDTTTSSTERRPSEEHSELKFTPVWFAGATPFSAD